MEQRPASVPQAKQAGDVRSRWGWAEPSVWTDRMLTALEQGVQGGKWFSLIDKVYLPANLTAATSRVVGNRYVVDADLKGYFDSIPRDRLLQRVGERVSDGRVLSLIESFLKAGILEGLREWIPTGGAPQGAVLSPLLSNIYLHPLDVLMA